MGRLAQSLIAAGLVFLLLIASVMELVSVTAQEELPEDLRQIKQLYSPSVSHGSTMVEMAQREYDFYRENGLQGGQRYWSIVNDALGWTLPADSAWCACFVLCCAYQCGYIVEDGCFGDFKENNGNWIFWCGGLYSYLVDTTGLAIGYNTYSSYQPVPGDLIFFSPVVGSPRPEHVGIVQEVTDSGTVITIEGNSRNGVRRNVYPDYALGSYAYTHNGNRVLISAYAHPAYPDSEQQAGQDTPVIPTTIPLGVLP